MNTRQQGGIRRIIRAAGYSYEGLKSAFSTEQALRQEGFFAIVLVPVALFLPLSVGSKALMIASILLVIVIELINTAIEAIVDRISQDNHPLSKKAKDVGSAAVFVALVNAACVWGIILLG